MTQACSKGLERWGFRPELCQQAPELKALFAFAHSLKFNFLETKLYQSDTSPSFDPRKEA